jgi:hypothetical protein
MSKNNYDDYDDYELEFLIKKAAIALAEKDSELFDRLEKDDTIINPDQDELDKKIYAMIDEHFNKNGTRRKKKKKLKSLMFKVAALVLILSSGFIIPYITVDAFRERVVNFYIENFDTHASFGPKEENEPFTEFEAGYLPEGYVKGDEFKAPNLYSQTFYNQVNKMIDITLYDDDTSFNIDTENCETYNVTIKNKNGYIYIKADSVALIFKFHDKSIVITGNDDSLSNEELIKIAESIK